MTKDQDQWRFYSFLIELIQSGELTTQDLLDDHHGRTPESYRLAVQKYNRIKKLKKLKNKI